MVAGFYDNLFLVISQFVWLGVCFFYELIGDVDFLKLGHHGYEHSNTPDFLATIKPEYAVITNDDGNGYRSTLDCLNDHHVDYLYSTSDENAVVATITENDVYLNFETTNQIKR